MSIVGDGIQAGNARWSFHGESAEHFDDHVSKSVPHYDDGHKIICDLSDFFLAENSLCYELGCSTGRLTAALAKHKTDVEGLCFRGIDVEPDMIDLANARKADQQLNNVDFSVDDILQTEFEPCDLIVAYYTVQFVRPAQRQLLFDKIYESLNWGGAFILFEKVRANDARFQDITTSLYNEYKLDQGYSADEIFAKNRSLKGVLEPFSTQGNMELLQRGGFVDILTVFKYLSFEGFLAIK